MTKGIFSENRRLDAIAGSDGWPLVGHTFDYLRGHYAFSARMHETFGDVYRMSAFWQRFVVLNGPDAAEFVLRDDERNFSNRLGWEPFLGRLFPDALLTRDFEDHRYHRRIMQSAFKKPAMVEYLRDMQRVIISETGQWANRSDFHVYPAIKSLTLKIAAAVFMGIDIADDEQRMTRAFLGMGEGLAPIIPYPVPGLALWRGMRGRQQIIDFLKPQIQQRRVSQGTDIFTRLCQATDDQGDVFSDQDVLNHMVNVLAAAHDTMTTALTVVIQFLAESQEWQHRLRSDCESDFLSFECLDRHCEMEWVFKEALRYLPPGPQMYRRTVKSCEFKGIMLAANTQVMLDVGRLHRDPALWREPDRFDPLRFSPAQARDLHTYQWVPFGGGAHTCIGLHFAMMQAKAILFHLLKRYQFKRVGSEPVSYHILPITRPVCGLPIALIPLAA